MTIKNKFSTHSFVVSITHKGKEVKLKIPEGIPLFDRSALSHPGPR